MQIKKCICKNIITAKKKAYMVTKKMPKNK